MHQRASTHSAPEPAVERRDEAVGGRRFWLGEVEDDILLVGPWNEIPADELRDLVDLDRLWIAHLPAYPLDRQENVLASVTEPRSDRRREESERVDDRQHPDLATCGELVVVRKSIAQVWLRRIAGRRSSRSFAFTLRFGALFRS